MNSTRKPTTCKCKDKSRWVVIERRKLPLTSRLYCLDCRWKWWSDRKYVAHLSDYKIASRSGMTDKDILQMIRDGLLRVDLETGQARRLNKQETEFRPLKRYLRVSHRAHYWFYKICNQGKQKRIAVHRLCWMFANRGLVPDGYDVDHIHGKDVENPDGINNLRILPSKVNQAGSHEDAF